MPTGDRRADVVRRVEGVRGTVSLRHSWVVRFDYGRIRPWVHREEVDGRPPSSRSQDPTSSSSPDRGCPRPYDGNHEETFDVQEGDRLDFMLTWVPSYRGNPEAVDIDTRLATPWRSSRPGPTPAGTTARGAARSSAAW